MSGVRVVEGVTASHRAVEAAVALLDDRAMAEPSCRAGWSVGRVVAALAGHDDEGRTASRLLDDLCRYHAVLEGEFAVAGPGAEAPLLRWRDVVVHHTDLGVGYDWDDWPADYVRLDLERMTMLWNSRRPMGLTGLPPLALQAPPAQRLAWLLGRARIDGVAAVTSW